MDLKLLLCFVMISPILAQFPNWGQSPQTPQQLTAFDRARSVWNFNHPLNQRVAINQSQRQIVPGALRRQGINPKAITSGRKKKVQNPKAPIPLPLPRPRHKAPKSKGKMLKSRNIHQKKTPLPPQTYQPHPFQQVSRPPRWLRRRASRKINPRKDSILTRFRKEDLWHLDKGEGYPLKNEDLLNDHFQRRQTSKGLETNEIFDEDHYKEYSHDEEDHPPHDHEESHQHLEEQAEKLINKAEGVVCNKNHETGEGNAPTHLHHHHHYAEGSATPAPKKVPNETLILPTLPRIHNPIPLGCLLTWPVFHPIRPRNHLACLLSIPGTPNLLKRKRRSADFQEEEQASASRRSYSSSKFPFGLTNQLKVPATVIAPPQFEKSDLLSMLMGSGGISPKNMGTVLATNSRYVRFGRGFPNRQGRSNWYPSNRPFPQAPQANQKQPSTSSSNHMPSVVKPKVNPPLVVNVHFNPSASRPTQPVSPRPSSHKAPVHKAPLKKQKQKWKPIYRAKSRRPYHYYDIYSSESKQSFSKIKPMKSLQESIEEAHQSIADDSLEESDEIEMDEDLVLESPEFNYDESPAELEEEAEQDLSSTPTIEETQKSPDIKTFSFAVKKNRDTPVLVFKTDDEVSSIPSPLEDADTDEVAESEGEGTDVAYYYKLVRKLAGDIEEPIIINVPKEVSNEVKK